MNAMILCAGLGTRLRPLTEKVPKPLAPIFDRPVADYTLESLSVAGARRVAVNMHHLPDLVQAHFRRNSHGTDIAFSLESEILGAVGGVRSALSLFDDNSPIVVVNGDILIDLDFRALLHTHIKSGAALTMTLGKISHRPELHVVGADPVTGKVLHIREHRLPGADNAEQFVNLGAFVYEPDILKQYVPSNHDFGFADELIPLLFKNGNIVAAHFSNGSWNDIGSTDSYLQAHFDVQNGGGFPPAALEMNKEFDTSHERISIGKNAYVHPGAIVGPYTIIGADSVIENGVKLSECVVTPGAKVTAGTIFHHEIIF